MSYFSAPDKVRPTQNPPIIKQNETKTTKTFGFAIAIIFGAGGVIVAGIGLAGCLGAISGLNQVNSIIMVASGGIGGIVLLMVGIVGTVKNQAQKKGEDEKGVKKGETPKQNDQVNKAKEKEKAKKLEKENAKEAELARKLAKATESQKAKEKKEADKAKDLKKENAKEDELAKKLAKATESEKAKEKEKANKAKELEKEKAKEAEKPKDSGKAKLSPQNEIFFSDNVAKLFDRTAGKVAKIKPFLQHCPQNKGAPQHDVILLGNAMVLFSSNLSDILIFSRAQNTDHVIIEDEGRSGVYRIKEVQTNGQPDNNWIVDTNKKFHIETVNSQGLTPIYEITPVCMIEGHIPKGYDGVAAGATFKQYVAGHLTRTLKKGY